MAVKLTNKQKECGHIYGVYISEGKDINYICDTTDEKYANETSHDIIMFDMCPKCGRHIKNKKIPKGEDDENI